MGTTCSPDHHHHHHHLLLNQKLITRGLYCLIPLAIIHLYLFPLPFTQPPNPAPHHYSHHPTISPQAGTAQHKEEIILQPITPPCDYSIGQWLPTTTPPLYNTTTCSTIKEGQNCIAHGRPDTTYLHYKWQPTTCNLPLFTPTTFLHIIRHKHLAFIGDSIARNQLESLLCLLSTSSPPILTHQTNDNKTRHWIFPSHNATISIFWSPFLVKGTEKSQSASLQHNKLYLSSPDEKWAQELDSIDIVIFSAGHWFLHPAIYYENGSIIGCHQCNNNHTEIGFFDVFQKAIRTALKTAVNKKVVVTTFSPAHFEGEWDSVDACKRTEPFKEGEKVMEYMDGEMRRVEVDEVKKVMGVEVLDVTRMAMMRPDGHPGPYMYKDPFADGVKEKVQNDCVHWCLPGPIDAWNEILLALMMRWGDQ